MSTDRSPPSEHAPEVPLTATQPSRASALPPQNKFPHFQQRGADTRVVPSRTWRLKVRLQTPVPL